MDTIHAYFNQNILGNDYIIGDLHGKYDLFIETLEEISFNPKTDRIFSVGDLIDRGDKSLQCLQLLTKPWFYAVRGNHEDLMIESILHSHEFIYIWLMNGGNWHRNEDPYKLIQLARIANKLPYSNTLATKFGDVGICHAEPPTDNWEDVIHPTEYHKQTMLWSRNRIRHIEPAIIKGVYRTVHGHTIVKKPLAVSNMLFIDTGAYKTNILTIVDINNDN